MSVAVSNPVHFLLVDDLPENLLSLEALLRREGLVLLKAKSGPEALELLLQYDVALALLDVQMPGMDGFELAELMRGTERTRRVPIIFLTAGSADWQRRFRGYEAGAVDFLHKPIEPDILKSKTSVFFELYRQQQQLAAQRDALKVSSDENARLLKESIQYAGALKEADRRKDEFLATLAHELRNPLASIHNGLHILREGADGDVAGRVQDVMARQLTHLVRLVDDLLDVSRVSEGKINLRRERIILQDALRTAAESGRAAMQAANHSFKMDMPEDPLWLRADMTRIAQVFGNIIDNAAKYTPPDGTVTVTARREGDDAVVSVRDSGVGIPREKLDGVFDLFAQVDSNLHLAQGGLGIGLSLVRQLVELHGGTVTAESAGKGQGSTFTVRLPLRVESGMDGAETAPARLGAAGQPLNVLVVDDNVDCAVTTGMMLKSMGHKPTLVHNGVDALAAARDGAPDVILLDIGMPGMSGYNLCRELRKDPRFKKIMMIAQTGWGQDSDRQQAYDAGFTHHLIKPVDFKKLSSLLEEV